MIDAYSDIVNCEIRFTPTAAEAMDAALTNRENARKLKLLNALAMLLARQALMLKPNRVNRKVEYVSTAGADIYFRIEEGPTVVVDGYAF